MEEAAVVMDRFKACSFSARFASGTISSSCFLDLYPCMHQSFFFLKFITFFLERTARDCVSFVDREGSFTFQLTGFTETYSRALTTTIQNTRLICSLDSATGKKFNTYFWSSPTTRPKRLQMGLQERGYSDLGYASPGT